MLSVLLLFLSAQIPAVPGETTLVLRAAEEGTQEERDSEASRDEEDAAPEPPECKGQTHHVISRPIARKLRIHQTLRGLYEPRDERFKARARDEESHCGYQTWYREVDSEVIDWLERHARATPKQFEQYLREIYSRPEMRKRFPNGF